ncbi:MAG TPA: hypothetical protein VFJ09_01205 [Nocardioidaceae bacterium]|nr:hypothetical protein [Nocardioidaceae bacterium]
MTEPQTYDVVLLVEQPLSAQDARQVRSLHEGIEGPVRYHVVLPVEDAAARVESAMGSLAASEVLASPTIMLSDVNLEEVQQEILEHARDDVSACVDRMADAGGNALGTIVNLDPIDAVAAKAKEVDAAEVIILTRPHVVAEFFHMDWSSRARRKLGVPVLHLLEHESFDEQAGGGEGSTGM